MGKNNLSSKVTCFSLILGWDPEEKRYIDAIRLSKNELMYLIEMGKLAKAKNIEHLPDYMEAVSIVLPENISHQKALIQIYTAVEVPDEWLVDQQLFEENKGLLHPDAKENQKERRIEFSFQVEEGEEFEIERNFVIAVHV